MSLAKNVWSDLVEKRLWPVVLLLLIALVAVPTLFGGESAEVAAEVAPPAGATGATGAAGVFAEIALDEPVAVRANRSGDLRDPFRQRGRVATVAANALGALPTATSSGVTPSAGVADGGAGGSTPGGGVGSAPPVAPSGPSTGGPSAPGPSASGPSASGPSASGPTGSAPSKPAGTALENYVSEVWLGLVDVEPTRRSVNRLTPLPRVDDPIFVYLGVLSDRKTAVFLLPESVTASGDGRCQPSTSVCETIELQVGDKTRLTVAADNGDVLQYDLELLEVHRKGVSTRSTAQPAPRPAAATPKATAAAAEAVPDLGTDRYAYDKRTGLLRRRADAPTAETTVAGAPAPADGAPAALGDPLAPGLDALAAPAAPAAVP